MQTGAGVPRLGRAQRPCSASRARCSAAVDVAAQEASSHRHSLGRDRVVAVETPGNARRGDVPNSFEGIVQTDLIWQQARPENGARTACEVVQSGSVVASASVTDTGDTGRPSAHTRGGEDVPGRTWSRQSSPRSFRFRSGHEAKWPNRVVRVFSVPSAARRIARTARICRWTRRRDPADRRRDR